MLGVFHGNIGHTLLSGWPVFRLATIFGWMLSLHGLGERQLLAYYVAEHTTCPHNHDCAATTICGYYKFDTATCPLTKIRSLLNKAKASVTSPKVLDTLKDIEVETRRWINLAVENPTVKTNTFGTFERFVRHSLDAAYCRSQPRMFWEFAATGLWHVFGELELAVANAAWVPRGFHGSDALTHVGFVDALFSNMKVGMLGAAADLSKACLGAGTRPRIEDEAWATVLLSGAPPERMVWYTEAVRTLHFSVMCMSKVQRPFLVLTDGKLPDDVQRALTSAQMKVHIVDTSEIAAAIEEALPSNAGGASAWNVQRGLAGSAMAIKFYLWTFLEYKRIVFLDADTLVLESIEELFSVPITVLSSDPIIDFKDFREGSTDTLNFGVISLSPSASQYNDMLITLPKCKELLEYYPLHDYTDASFLDCVWRLIAGRALGGARFNVNISAMPHCIAGNKRMKRCLMFAEKVAADAEPETPFSGCLELQQRGLIPRAALGGDKPFVRCALPLSYAAPVDFRSLFWLASFELTHGSLKGRRFPTANLATQSLAKAFLGDRTFAGPIQVLHWPTAFMKPWDHCLKSTRTAFDELWWAMRIVSWRSRTLPGARIDLGYRRSPSKLEEGF
eukprot:TRINITY_DN17093_c0_g1_i2.p1 TRINITY_DN17093_c0_g1~~TRINITY_DN17093_c0_g1_i2.p1  ORF type:complete len:619 (+),score=73.73 TRINITY_DN17093_c0_g1_i2:149-2005(+)